MTKESIVREYRSNNLDMPTLTLSRKIYNEGDNKLLFTNVEDVRTCLRRIEGKIGAKAKAKIKDKSLFMDEARPYNPFKLPDSDAADLPKYIIEPKGKLGIISDIHVPFHSIEALSISIDFFKKEKIDKLLVLGDLFDFYGGSKYLKDPRQRRMHEEISIGCELLEVLNKELKCPIIFKQGNHDSRFEHYLWQKVIEIPQLMDLQEIKELTLEKVLDKRLDFKLEHVASKQFIDFCGLNIIHGHEPAFMFSPVNAARGLYMKAKGSALTAHHHVTSSHSEKTINDEIISTYSIGCMCQLKPEYAPLNNWNWGFATVAAGDNEKEYHVKNYKIINGKIY